MTLSLLASSRAFPGAVDSVVVSSVAKYALDAVYNISQRKQHREQCSARVRSQEASAGLKFADQAILANLDWGIDALDEAIQTANAETRAARLDHAEKMLHICCLLDVTGSTAGVPNSYLAAWAHLNLAFVWKLRNDDRKATKHMLDMFLADAYYSRVDFAPDLWERLFQPHFLGIMTWYCDQRSKLLTRASDAAACDVSVDYSFSRDDDFSYSRDDAALGNALSRVTPDQMEELQVLELLYQNSLDDHTQKYARYYKNLLNNILDSSTANQQRKVLSMPTAEPPVTLLESSLSFTSRGARELDVIQEDMDEVRSKGSSISLEEKAASSLKHSRSSSFNSPRYSNHPSRSSSFRYNAQLSRHLSYEAGKISCSSEIEGRSSSFEQADVLRNNSPRPKSVSKHKHSKSLRKSNSKRLFEIFEEQNVNIPSPVRRVGLEKQMEELRREKEPSRTPSAGSLTEDSADVEVPKYARPPKDFVCPITNQLFKDPVTLETGQTYERRAIQEWVDRGNITCPITRKSLVSRTLPQTNYVLKRLVENWKEQNPGHPCESPLNSFPSSGSSSEELKQESCSPDSVASSRGALGDSIKELTPATTTLCVSEDLEECEKAVLTIASVWEKTAGTAKVEANITRPGVIQGLMEVLSVSTLEEVQNAALSVLSAVVSSDEFNTHAVIRADPELDCITKLIKKGLDKALVLLFQLNIPVDQLSRLNLIPDLMNSMKNIKCDFFHEAGFHPRTIAVILLEKLLTADSANAEALISLGGVPILVGNLGTQDSEERVTTLSVLLCCTRIDGRCRSFIARTTELRHVLELISSGQDSARNLAIVFLTDLLQLNRRAFINNLLKAVKHKGVFSTMHALLVYIQNAPPEQQLTAASLLLQLDLMNVPGEPSIYMEESMAIILSALTNKDFLNLQVQAANLLASLAGHFSYTGKPITEAWLLKIAGINNPYDTAVNEEAQTDDDDASSIEENQAAAQWEFNAASAVLGYESGTILTHLSVNLQSKSLELSRPSMIAAVWLSRMINVLPDMGLRSPACRSFLTSFLVFLESAQHNQQRALAALGLHTFLDHSESFQELLCYAKDIIKPLRQLRKLTRIAQDLLAAFISNTTVDQADMWQHGQVGTIDVSRSGEVRALARSKGRLFSGHSDGTIQVWDTKNKVPTLLVVLKEHRKAVTSLAVSSSSSRLYSGSLDKTVRVWTISADGIQCIDTMDLRECVYGIACNRSVLSIVTQNNGIKVQSEHFSIKCLNSSKNVQCIAMSNGKIYCGCSDNSIQEVNPEDGSVATLQPGVRILLGKRPIYAIQVWKNEMFTAASNAEGAPVKIWDQLDNSLIKSVPTSSDVRALVANDDFLYLGLASGSIEIWLKDNLVKISSVAVGSKVNALVLDKDTLYSGSDDGKVGIYSFVH